MDSKRRLVVRLLLAACAALLLPALLGTTRTVQIPVPVTEGGTGTTSFQTGPNYCVQWDGTKLVNASCPAPVPDFPQAFDYFVDPIHGVDSRDCADDYDPDNPDPNALTDCCGAVNNKCRSVSMVLEIIAHQRDNGAMVCDGDPTLVCSEVVSNPDPGGVYCGPGQTLGECVFTGEKCNADYWAGPDESCQPNDSVCSSAGAGVCNAIWGFAKKYVIHVTGSATVDENLVFPVGGNITLLSDGAASVRGKDDINRPTVLVHDASQVAFRNIVLQQVFSGAGDALRADGMVKGLSMFFGGLTHMGSGADYRAKNYGNATHTFFGITTFGFASNASGDSMVFESVSSPLGAGICREGVVAPTSLSGGSASNVDPDAAAHVILKGQPYGTLTHSALNAKNVKEGDRVYIDSGTGAGQVRYVIFYDDATDTLHVDTPWYRVPDSTSTFKILGDLRDEWCNVDNDCPTAGDVCFFGDYPTTIGDNGGTKLNSADFGIYGGSWIQPGPLSGAAVKFLGIAGGSAFNNFVEGATTIDVSQDEVKYPGEVTKGVEISFRSPPMDCRGGTCVAVSDPPLEVSLTDTFIRPNTGTSTEMKLDTSLEVADGASANLLRFRYDACQRNVAPGSIFYGFRGISAGNDNGGGNAYLGILDCDAPPNPQKGELWWDGVNQRLETAYELPDGTIEVRAVHATPSQDRTWKQCVYIDDPAYYQTIQGADNNLKAGIQIWPNDFFGGEPNQGVTYLDNVHGRIADDTSGNSVSIQVEIFDGVFGISKGDFFTSDCVVDVWGRKDCDATLSKAGYVEGKADVFKLRVTNVSGTPGGLTVCLQGHFE